MKYSYLNMFSIIHINRVPYVDNNMLFFTSFDPFPLNSLSTGRKSDKSTELSCAYQIAET